MKKVLTLSLLLSPLLAFAANSTSTVPTWKDTSLATTTVTCVQSALEKRENSLITGHDVYNTAVKTALTKRLENLKTAWAQTERKDRADKRQVAYKVFKTDMQVANTAMKTVRNSAWKTFETDAKACGIKGGTGESPAIIGGANITL